jgi:hypothetical protein
MLLWYSHSDARVFRSPLSKRDDRRQMVQDGTIRSLPYLDLIDLVATFMTTWHDIETHSIRLGCEH